MVDVHELKHHKDDLLPRGVGQCNAFGPEVPALLIVLFGLFKKHDPYLLVVELMLFLSPQPQGGSQVTNVCVSVLAMCVLCHQQPVGVLSVYVGRIHWCFTYNMSLKWLFYSRFSPKQVVFTYKMKVFILSLLIFEMFEIQ